MAVEDNRLNPQNVKCDGMGTDAYSACEDETTTCRCATVRLTNASQCVAVRDSRLHCIPKRRSERHLTHATVVRWLLKLYVFMLILVSPSCGQPREEPCPNIDIRSKVVSFEPWLNCTVIEGGLQILLISNNLDFNSFDGISFKYLREITDFLLITEVQQLRTLSNMFPRLSVIRGNKLYKNNALTLYQNDHLQDIGLSNLTAILRGSVHIEKNPQLCYVDTIDWNEIMREKEGFQNRFFDGNMHSKNCPNRSDCPSNCLGSPNGYCWNVNMCQRSCLCDTNIACYTNEPKKCCDEQCIGGCNGPGPSDCIACKNWLDTDNKTCIETCRQGTFQYMRRCISLEECMALDAPRLLTKRQEKTKFEEYIAINATEPHRCDTHCPDNYKKICRNGIRLCDKCQGECRRIVECRIDAIFTVHMAKEVYDDGCTHVNQLIINVRGGPETEKKLAQYLQNVEVVSEYVKIYHSEIASLGILSRLKSIEGNILCCGTNETARNALVVQDNKLLSELWNWDKTNLTIKKGGLFFHNNPKLCVDRIKTLYDNAKIQSIKWESLLMRDVSNFTNGDKGFCSKKMITLLVDKYEYVYDPNANTTKYNGGVQADRVLLAWNNIGTNMRDYRNLMGYSVIYKKLEKDDPIPKVEDYIHVKDEDKDHGWMITDCEAPPKKTDERVDISIAYLQSYTRYAAFVQTFMLPTAIDTGAYSNVINFTTLTSRPSPPEAVVANARSSTELFVKWSPPLFPNGVIEHYWIKYTKQEENLDNFLKRVNQGDKCTHISGGVKPNSQDKDDQDEDDDAITVEQKTLSLKERLDKYKDKVAFLDGIISYVYSDSSERDDCLLYGPKEEDSCNYACKMNRTNSKIRRRRYAILQGNSSTDNTISLDVIKNQTIVPIDNFTTTEKPLSYYKKVDSDKMTAVLDGLDHFKPYLIEVRACQVNGKRDVCSSGVKILHKTGPMEKADNVRNVEVKVNDTTKMVIVTWEKPELVNGRVLSYQVECFRADESMLQVEYYCEVPKEGKTLQSYRIRRQLDSGDYIMKVRAWSLNGPGNWSHAKFHINVDGMRPEIVAVIVLVIIAILGGFIAGFWWHNRQMKRKNADIISSRNPEYKAYVPDEWEVDRSNVIIGGRLGQGCFGDVFQGILKKESAEEVACAIKTVTEGAELSMVYDFLNEASVMKEISAYHVIRLEGVVSQGNPPLVLMELMPLGDLRNWLRKNRPEETDARPPTFRLLCKMAAEIADGMAYLADHKFVHRDLAARNCMLTENLTVKVGDLGMARDLYESDYYKKRDKGLLPVRWMAPESLGDGIFKSSSDVWSYGIVLWEMVTLAQQPYKGLSHEQVSEYVMRGYTMDMPENCPEELYAVMQLCWQLRPQLRPSFQVLVERFLDYVSENFKEVAYYYTRYNIIETEDSENMVGPMTPLTAAEDTQSHQSAHHHLSGMGSCGMTGEGYSMPCKSETGDSSVMNGHLSRTAAC